MDKQLTKLEDIASSSIKYYNEKYEKNRSDDFSIEKSVEEQLNYIRNILAKDENEITKLAEAKTTSLSMVDTSKYKSEIEFTIDYLSLESANEFKTKYGLDIHIYRVPEKDTIWIISVSDWMYLKTYYYQYNLKEYKIVETFKNEHEAENMAHEYEQAHKK